MLLLSKLTISARLSRRSSIKKGPLKTADIFSFTERVHDVLFKRRGRFGVRAPRVVEIYH